MTIHIPLFIFWFILVAMVWVLLGFVADVALICVEPGIALGVSRAHRRLLMLLGPLHFWNVIALALDKRRHK